MKKTTFLVSCALLLTTSLGIIEPQSLWASNQSFNPSHEDLKEAVDEVMGELNKIATQVIDHNAEPTEKIDEYKDTILKNFGQYESIISLHKDVINWVVALGVHSPIALSNQVDIPIDVKQYAALSKLYQEKLSNRNAEEFIKHLAVIVRELHVSASHVEHASTSLSFENATSTVTDEFKALGVKNFHQTNFDSTCLLLSSLYAIQQKPKLLSMFNTHVLANIRKDKSGNYVLKLPSGEYQAYNQDRAVKYPDSRLHTNFPIFIKALSFYFAEAMRTLGHLREIEAFTISDTEGKDYFFGKPVGFLGLTARVEEGNDPLSPALKQVVLKKDGTLVFDDAGKNHHVTGEFFVSGATKMGVGGHAVSIFYNGTTWILYDNLKEAAQPLTNLNMPTRDTSFYVVGDYKIQ